ncbi:glycosyltransferase family 2 protein [Ectothiorhodospiraceae bacterium BW-2]|nr:glycosyltransferase family 2 protein [Ectothiorhodospiraceae bacterium BW-2]
MTNFSMPDAAVVISTYNGAAWLAAQLDSILSQSYRLNIVVRDDGSSDRTLNTIQNYQQNYPQQIRLLKEQQQRLGPMRSYSYLLEQCDAPYLFLADQDDVWHPSKAVLLLAQMHQLEQQWGQNMPLLVFSDARVIDEQGRVMAASYWQHIGIWPGKTSLSLAYLLQLNFIPGCTMLINRALAKLALPVPATAMMHDWWLLLVAAAFGQIGVVEQPLIDYRQHGANTVGITDRVKIHSRSDWQLFRRRRRQLLEESAVQAAAFLTRYRQQLSAAQNSMLYHYSRLPSYAYPRRLYTLLRYRLLKERWIKSLRHLLLI